VIAALLIAAAIAAVPAAAVGPERVAAGDRARWPEPLGSPAAFDRASRAEILSFTAALAETDALDDAALAPALGIRKINRESLRRWRDEAGRRLLQNFRRAAAGCAAGEPFCGEVASPAALRALAAGADGSLADAYRPWRDDARAFHRVYATEQLRLAALFPAPTSEILTVSPRERTGFELDDRQFLLTFDDGPTAPGGTTDATLAMLRRAGVNGVFFAQGEHLQARQRDASPTDAPTLYAGMCVASHGWSHDSHQRRADWPRSVDDTTALLRRTLASAHRPLFRPPYGQRTLDSGDAFAARGLTVVLWNIDSQDWNPRIAAGDVGARVLSLMLLWRRGIVLFHDVHDRALAAVPYLVDRTRNAGVGWVDCRRYPA
jgi:peptidoglycan/xylan/chitin deacetylase (PgdA/CDA1 family)